MAVPMVLLEPESAFAAVVFAAVMPAAHLHPTLQRNNKFTSMQPGAHLLNLKCGAARKPLP